MQNLKKFRALRARAILKGKMVGFKRKNVVFKCKISIFARVLRALLFLKAKSNVAWF